MSHRPRSRSRRTRLQKYLSDAGVASRRHAERYIRAGRVLVNDEIVDTLPAFIDPAADKVTVDGTPVRAQRHQYFLVHKPKGFVCTNRDPGGRRRAVDLLPSMNERLVPVGRLDVDSCGLLLMTNDGELAQRLTHPRFGIAKVYRVEVRGQVESDLPARMEKGVFLSDGKARAGGVRIVHSARDRSVLTITLDEGRNRQIRRMLARLGHPVKTLKRVQIGPLSVKGLPAGAARRLAPRELEVLRQAVEDASATAPTTRARTRARRSAAGKRPDARPASTAPATNRAHTARGERESARGSGKSKPSARSTRKRRLIT